MLSAKSKSFGLTSVKSKSFRSREGSFKSARGCTGDSQRAAAASKDSPVKSDHASFLRRVVAASSEQPAPLQVRADGYHVSFPDGAASDGGCPADLGTLSSNELASKILLGNFELATSLQKSGISGADLEWLIEAKSRWLPDGDGTSLTSLTSLADGLSLAWTTTCAEPLVLPLTAARGEDGLIGLEIRDDPGQQVYNVIVGILPGSRADRDGNFELGDVILEVDGVRLAADDGTSRAREVRQVMQAGKPSYRFTVLRAVNFQRLDPTAAEAAGVVGAASDGAESPHSPTSPNRFKLNLAEISARPKAGLAPGVSPRQLFSASTPRSIIFAHAASLQNKHLKLARAQGTQPPPSLPKEAEAQCDALAKQPAALNPDIDLTMRHKGRSVDDWGLCV